MNNVSFDIKGQPINLTYNIKVSKIKFANHTKKTNRDIYLNFWNLAVKQIINLKSIIDESPPV